MMPEAQLLWIQSFYFYFIYLALLGGIWSLCCGRWDLVPQSRIKPGSPPLGGRVLTTGPPWKSLKDRVLDEVEKNRLYYFARLRGTQWVDDLKKPMSQFGEDRENFYNNYSKRLSLAHGHSSYGLVVGSRSQHQTSGPTALGSTWLWVTYNC